MIELFFGLLSLIAYFVFWRITLPVTAVLFLLLLILTDQRNVREAARQKADAARAVTTVEEDPYWTELKKNAQPSITQDDRR